tara:strand:+ start:2682 stop:3116 length:435 start_codon:yes stop_codon:yes gene_type:complete
MKLISHRGNTLGTKTELENNPDYIMSAIKDGFDVEIDVWSIKDRLYLGHDEPEYEVNLKFLQNDKLWCHAKNLFALEYMLLNNVHCFWHQEDDYTITSRGHIWTYPEKMIGKQSVIVCKSKKETVDTFKKSLYGICSDFVGVLI